jgi:Sec-independent protein secretion pathway component TatC
MFVKNRFFWMVVCFIAFNLVIFYIVHALLLIGTRAQETFNYSSIKQLEDNGLLNTNISTLIADPPGKNLVSFNVLDQFRQSINVAILIQLTINVVFVLYMFPKRDKRS